MGRRRDRTLARPHHLPSEQRIRGGDREQRNRCHRRVQAAQVRPGAARRDDARHQRTRNAATDKGAVACHTRSDGDEERGGEHHGSGYRLEDCRLSDKACEPQPDSAHAEEEHTPQADCVGGDADGLSAELPGHLDADNELQHDRRLEGCVPPTGALGTGA